MSAHAKGKTGGSTVKQAGTYEKSAEGTAHTYSEEEQEAFVEWINDRLGKDKDLASRMPIKKADLFNQVADGLLICKLINDAVPDTIDERVLNKGTNLNIFKKTENQNVCINSASSIGCNVVNIGASDLISGTPHLVLGLIWQIIRIGLLSLVNLVQHPELYRLLEDGETIDDLMKLPPEQILLRWVNYHLKNAGSNKRIHNFAGDIKDSEAYTILLNQIAPKDKGVNTDALKVSDQNKRAEMVLDNADKIGCKKFLKPRDIVKGNPKLNLAFVANLFNNFPALDPVDEKIVVIEETREEKTFRNWMNSLGVNPFVNNLYGDLKDGLVLLQLFDIIQPGIVDWNKRVNRPPYPKLGGNMKQLENCNYCTELGKQLKFSLVGIQGKDIQDENKTLTLALVWQMMRAYVLSILDRLAKNGKRIGDNDIIAWANNKLKSAGKSTSFSNFKDSALANAMPIIDTVDAIRPGVIDYSIVTGGSNINNAKYAISSARKIGAVVFALPEDIVEVAPKMMLTVFAALMATDLLGDKVHGDKL
eukprot:TRINITY_DN7676_c0_g1_i1.p1 TRINITY_DN7676_c0_g1~~TRINITY_DN7676_c0_g1_i1.p1  ORF type:complete len:534 (+),score=129.36 TRINITY_DN7676_c0_g1_i1:77-1678(+)